MCGSSIGALVGAAHAAGELDALESWLRRLDWRQIVGYLDISLRGGLIKARRVFDMIGSQVADRPIESLERPFAAVATDLASGREIWLRDGSALEAVRASLALPGLLTPVRRDGRWLVDGGLVNPVPVSLCRALGAEVVVAVDLNTTLLGRRLRRAPPEEGPAGRSLRGTLQDLAAELRSRVAAEERDAEERAPSLFEVLANSLNIMQVRISRSRMAGEPPDLLVAPRLPDFGLLDFDRAEAAIAEGREAVRRALAPGGPSPG